MIDYKIISTGSQGNAVIVNDFILVDCGVTFKAIKDYIPKLKIVLLTHIHSDHFNKITIKNLARERPSLRFACGRWLAEPLVRCGVPKTQIDVLEANITYGYGLCNVIQVPLVHNVPNCGWKIHFANTGKMIYCTDTNNLNGIKARNYDLYMIEANYEDEIIQEKIRQKKESGQYAYELQVIKNHLSKKKANNFIYSNIGAKGQYIYMHCHVDNEDGEHNDNNGEDIESS